MIVLKANKLNKSSYVSLVSKLMRNWSLWVRKDGLKSMILSKKVLHFLKIRVFLEALHIKSH